MENFEKPNLIKRNCGRCGSDDNYCGAGNYENRLEWFRRNKFNTINPIIIFADCFSKYGIAYAKIQRRAFFIIPDFDPTLLSLFKPENLTFLGERHNFTFEFLRKINSLGLPVSIMTANTESSMIHFLNNSLHNLRVTINSIVLNNFFVPSSGNEDSPFPVAAILAGEALLLGAHGDVLCTALGESILCGKGAGPSATEDFMQPTCALTGECFREKCLGEGVKRIRLKELQAKILFLNTCGGFSITRTKFGEYQDLLPLRSIENHVVAYISSYLIKSSYVEEIHLFWVLLKRYGNIAQATYYLNVIRSRIFGSEPCFLILGDAILNLDFDRFEDCSFDSCHYWR